MWEWVWNKVKWALMLTALVWAWYLWYADSSLMVVRH